MLNYDIISINFEPFTCLKFTLGNLHRLATTIGYFKKKSVKQIFTRLPKNREPCENLPKSLKKDLKIKNIHLICKKNIKRLQLNTLIILDFMIKDNSTL